jgi:hypothetical protein
VPDSLLGKLGATSAQTSGVIVAATEKCEEGEAISVETMFVVYAFGAVDSYVRGAGRFGFSFEGSIPDEYESTDGIQT